ncbi:hypothetical protein TPHA_0H00260 [Tetrapisispora phaffii CBS 4417]|uniref:Magnesium-dependent phosphatase-1 n=1 Tax=Tetrapisispora phaffii (strain ATCC 24235 / CBS 4417 / NBRC 1672 / NRRL Y-8282 / UCD 70-5) TaxID=1071381 RepID=G8BWT2_TETPH|nr:hypothetical protein TPHA_0H00260 [Tetrapisispora phaffii CBS 4417]CCE64236.1 hypothetical protein TPHA_0H00260 [Tetrapisispora phaffii CBS 4417]
MTVVYPDVAAFDLDYTVWPCYCDTHLYPPFKPVENPNGEVYELIDSMGYSVKFFKDIPLLFRDLKDNGVKIVAASRTWAPEIAQELLKGFRIEYDGKVQSMYDFFDAAAWGDRSKVGHITENVKQIYNHDNIKNLKICLFDDESRNKDVERHGIKFVYIRNTETGPTWKLYQDYLNGKI